MVSKSRLQRIADRIREELSEMLLHEISDPRLAGISITDVDVDRELAFANVYISAIEGQERWRDILDGLKHAQGYLRHNLAQRIDLRSFPRLRFHWDPTYERAERIEQLLASIREEDQPAPGAEAEADNLDEEAFDEEDFDGDFEDDEEDPHAAG